MFLVEGYVDALALAALGYPAIAVGGTHMSERQLEELRHLPGPIYILPDADESGTRRPGSWPSSSTPRLRCAHRTTTRRKTTVIKDAADLFAAKGERQGSPREPEERGQGRPELAISEAPPKGDTLGGYRYFRQEELPLLMRLEDPGERRAALHNISNEQNLGLKILQSAPDQQLEEQAEEGAAERAHDDTAVEETLIPEPGSERYERAMELLRSPHILGLCGARRERSATSATTSPRSWPCFAPYLR